MITCLRRIRNWYLSQNYEIRFFLYRELRIRGRASRVSVTKLIFIDCLTYYQYWAWRRKSRKERLWARYALVPVQNWRLGTQSDWLSSATGYIFNRSMIYWIIGGFHLMLVPLTYWYEFKIWPNLVFFYY